MDFEKYNISKIAIIGKQKDSIAGDKLIAKVTLKNDDTFYAFLMPPLYLITEKIPDYIFDSAIAKHGYNILDDEIIINNEEEFQKFITSLEKAN